MTNPGVDTSWSMAPNSIELLRNEAHIWLSRLDRSCGDLTAVVISEEERRRADRFVFARDRERYVRSHTLLRQLLSQYLSIAPDQLRLAETSNGKPFLVGESRLAFNMSHTNTYGLFGFSREGAIGVDIERERPELDIGSLADSLLTASESAQIADAQREDQVRYFFRTWVRKEAVLKAAGQGLAIPLPTLEVSLADRVAYRTVQLANDPSTAWHVFDLPDADNHPAALATSKLPLRVRCFRVWS